MVSCSWVEAAEREYGPEAKAQEIQGNSSNQRATANTMAYLREETLNTYLALLLDSYEGITATAERRSSTEAIDITVVHGTAVAPIPILVLEAKIGDTPSKRREAVRQARSRLAATLRARSLTAGR